MLILKALSAYQHHESYRPLYEKLRDELPIITETETWMNRAVRDAAGL